MLRKLIQKLFFTKDTKINILLDSVPLREVYNNISLFHKESYEFYYDDLRIRATCIKYVPYVQREEWQYSFTNKNGVNTIYEYHLKDVTLDRIKLKCQDLKK